MEKKEISDLLYNYYENKCIEYFYEESGIENKKVYIKLLYKHMYSKNINFDYIATKLLSNNEVNSENVENLITDFFNQNNYGITQWGSSFGSKPLNEAGYFLSKLSTKEIETIILGLSKKGNLKIVTNEFKNTIFDSLKYLRMNGNGNFYDFLDMDYIDNLGIDRSSDIYFDSLSNLVKGEDSSENYELFLNSLSSLKKNNNHEIYLKDKESFFNKEFKKSLFDEFIKYYNNYGLKNLSILEKSDSNLSLKSESYSKSLSRNLGLIAKFVFSNDRYYKFYEDVFKKELYLTLDNESSFLHYIKSVESDKGYLKKLVKSIVVNQMNDSGSAYIFEQCLDVVYFKSDELKYFLAGFNEFIKTEEAYDLFRKNINYSHKIKSDTIFYLICARLSNFNYRYALEMKVDFDSDKGKNLLYLVGKDSPSDINYLKYSSGLNDKDKEIYDSIKNRTYFDSVIDKDSIKKLYIYIGLTKAKNVNEKSVNKCLHFIKPIIEESSDNFINEVLPSYFEEFINSVEDEKDVYNNITFKTLVSLSKNKKENLTIINKLCNSTNDFLYDFANRSSHYNAIGSSYLMYIMNNGYFKSYMEGVNKFFESNKLTFNEKLEFLYSERYSLITSSTFKGVKLLPKNSDKLNEFFYEFGLKGKEYLTEEILNNILDEINSKGSKKSLGNVRTICSDYYNLLNSKMSDAELKNNIIVAENLKNKVILFLKENSNKYRATLENNLLIINDLAYTESYILCEYFIIHEQFGRVYFDKYKKLSDKFNYRSKFSDSEKNILEFLNVACKTIKSKNLFSKEEKENDKKRMDRFNYLLEINKENLFNSGLKFEFSNKDNRNLVKIYNDEISYIFSTDFIYDTNKVEYLYKRKNNNSTLKPLIEEFKLNRNKYKINSNQLKILIPLLSDSFNLRKTVNINNK